MQTPKYAETRVQFPAPPLKAACESIAHGLFIAVLSAHDPTDIDLLVVICCKHGDRCEKDMNARHVLLMPVVASTLALIGCVSVPSATTAIVNGDSLATGLECLRYGMTSNEVTSILGREPDREDRPGGSLGNRRCWWCSASVTTFVEFDCGGRAITILSLPSQ